MYCNGFKFVIDFAVSIVCILLFSWLFIILAILVRFKLGKPVIFKQQRLGRINKNTGSERIFTIYKFRTMTDNETLPEEERFTKFGLWLRNTSLDEIPQLFNILKGDMALVGPRPIMINNAPFMSDRQRMRHNVRPGITGYAQINGRNSITWDQKFDLDYFYTQNVSFFLDCKILFLTFLRVFKKKDIQKSEMNKGEYGEYLLTTGKISQQEYQLKMEGFV